MNEKNTVQIMKNIRKGAIVCRHLREPQGDKEYDTSVGFNVPRDIDVDLEAWCDECEDIFSSHRNLHEHCHF